MIKSKEHDEVIKHLHNAKLPFDIKHYFSYKDLNKILTFMMKDKKNTSKKINLILLKKIGSTVIDKEYSKSKVEKILKKELFN